MKGTLICVDTLLCVLVCAFCVWVCVRACVVWGCEVMSEGRIDMGRKVKIFTHTSTHTHTHTNTFIYTF